MEDDSKTIKQEIMGETPETDDKMRVVKSQGWYLQHQFQANNEGEIFTVLEASNGDICVAGGNVDYKVRIYDSEYNLIHTLDDHTDVVNLIKQYRQYLLTAADDYTIQCYDIENDYQHISTLKDTTNRQVVAFEPYPEWKIISAGVGQYIKFWDMLSWKCLTQVKNV